MDDGKIPAFPFSMEGIINMEFLYSLIDSFGENVLDIREMTRMLSAQRTQKCLLDDNAINERDRDTHTHACTDAH